MKIMITGNQGYIGPVVTRHLREKRAQSSLVGLDAAYFEHCTVSPTQALNQSFLPHEQRKKDVRDLTPKDFEGVDGVVHLAAISNDPMGKAFEDVTFAVNHEATLIAAKAAKVAGVKKFVFASSCSVYGKAGDQQCHENSPLFPLTAYASSKAKAEEGLASIASKDFQVTSFRFATACGASPRIRLDLVLNDFVATALSSKRIDILSDGTPWRPLIDVQDMARAFEWALFERHDVDPFLVLNAGRSSWNFQIRALADTVSKICAEVPVSVNPKAAPDNRSYSVDFKNFESRNVLGASPRQLDKTVLEILAVLKDVQDLGKDFRNSRFIRLKTLTDLRAGGLIDQNLRVLKT